MRPDTSNTTPLPAKFCANEGIAQDMFFQSDDVYATSYRDKNGYDQAQVEAVLPGIGAWSICSAYFLPHGIR